MNYNNRAIRCTFGCGSAVQPRITETKLGGRLIKEAKYICPKCGSYCKREVIEDKPIK